jgi:hypothetical protein
MALLDYFDTLSLKQSLDCATPYGSADLHQFPQQSQPQQSQPQQRQTTHCTSIPRCFEKIIDTNLAILRIFGERKFRFDQQIVPSVCTYVGMLDSLQHLLTQLQSENKNINEICVLCPYYCKTNNPTWPGMDTQSCGGGKVASRDGSHEQAASEELAEELRICSNIATLVNTSTLSPKHCDRVTGHITSIYKYHASTCSPIVNFDPIEYGRLLRRGADISTERVGFVVWGTLGECIDLVSSIPVNQNSKIQVDSIEGISIVFLRKAINMAKFATRKLTSQIKSAGMKE